MNKETFNNHKKLLQKEFEEQLHKFYVRCASELAIAKEGEFVQNEFYLIKVKSISYQLIDDYIEPVYYGYEYTVREGQPVKVESDNIQILMYVHKVEFSSPEEFKLGYVVNKLRYKDGGSTTLVFDSGDTYTKNNALGSKLKDSWFYGDIKNIHNRVNIVGDLGLIKRLEQYLNDKT